jgi:hypothetical protein
VFFWQGIALRGLFIIDKEGVIQHSTINNLAIGRSVDETMRTLQVCSLLAVLHFMLAVAPGLRNERGSSCFMLLKSEMSRSFI